MSSTFFSVSSKFHLIQGFLELHILPIHLIQDTKNALAQCPNRLNHLQRLSGPAVEGGVELNMILPDLRLHLQEFRILFWILYLPCIDTHVSLLRPSLQLSLLGRASSQLSLLAS